LRLPSFLLLSFEKCAEAIKLRVPELLMAVEPFHRPLQCLSLQAAVHDPAGLPPFDQSGILENAEMLHESRQRHSERPGELTRRALAPPKPRQDGAPRGVGQRAEYGTERIAFIVNHSVQCRRAPGRCQ